MRFPTGSFHCTAKNQRKLIVLLHEGFGTVERQSGDHPVFLSDMFSHKESLKALEERKTKN